MLDLKLILARLVLQPAAFRTIVTAKMHSVIGMFKILARKSFYNNLENKLCIRRTQINGGNMSISSTKNVSTGQ